jgi:DNA-binding XRE family transcriptional regulator
MGEKKFSKLISIREKYHISQHKMAKVIDKSRSTYISREKGETDFYRDEMVKITDYINARAKAEGDKPITLEQIFLQ